MAEPPQPTKPEDPPRPQQPTAVSVQTAGRVLLALVLGQLGVHAVMAGLRLAASLQLLAEGYSAWALGLLLALFSAAPVAFAFAAGRLADRWGYHKPVLLAVVLSLVSVAVAVNSTFLGSAGQFLCLCVAAMGVGTASNLGMLTIQRTAGLTARDSTERVRIFSWLGVAPPLSNVVGPVLVGFIIDAAGFRAAYLTLLLLPLLTLLTMRLVPVLAPVTPAPSGAAGMPKPRAWDLLRAPDLRRLLAVNWLLSMCWDVHIFAVPILGHAKGFSASTLGLILGSFTVTITLVRMLVPFIAARLEEVTVLRTAMAAAALVFAAYPLAPTPWAMAACSMLLGLALGCVQPMMMSMLHHVTPDGRHGESLALRSMVSHASSTLMPLVFGASGTLVGAGALFWIVGTAVGSGVWVARRLRGPRLRP